MKKQSVSIKDVAKYCGVSIATVSNVLNNRNNVSQQVREHVLEAVKKLDYVVNPYARGMRSAKTRTIGVVVLDFSCISFTPLIRGIEDELGKADYNVLLYDSNYSGMAELSRMRNMKNRMVEGIILASGYYEKNARLYEELFGKGSENEIPIIYIGRDMRRFSLDSVYIDNRQAARTATAHLIEMGCRHIAIVNAPSEIGSSIERGMGYADALKAAGLATEDDLALVGNHSALSGFNAVQKLLRERREFDAIFATNDQMAVGAIRALRSAGVRVPEDVRIVGYDNTFISSIVEPSLTTISVPIYEMGAEGARQMIRRLEKPSSYPADIKLDYELIIRGSTVASAQTHWDMTHW